MAFLLTLMLFFFVKNKHLISISWKVATAETLTDLRIQADCSK